MMTYSGNSQVHSMRCPKNRVFFFGGGIASNNVTYLQVTSRATLEVSNNSFLERRSVYHMYELVNYHELLWECIHNYYNYYNYYPKYQYIELPWTTSIFALEVCLQFYFDCFSPAFFHHWRTSFFFFDGRIWIKTVINSWTFPSTCRCCAPRRGETERWSGKKKRTIQC